MEFINHTINWCRGEIFEGRIYFLFGLVLFIISILYWKYGSTPFARGVIIPFAVVAIFSIAGGLTLNFSNQSRIVKYQQEYKADPQIFIESEKARTDRFIKWYPYTLFSMAGLIVIGLILFLFLHSPHGKGIGLGLILLGFSIIYLDHFSEERAAVYHQHIMENIQK
jgi:hypothetical protein